ncbi:uncharacterized protein [Argopecten irradians]|uniref:uncharacterized protein n=1 Tax=Argopecten irradians TaxID=31199 RepID=UPI00371EEEB1
MGDGSEGTIEVMDAYDWQSNKRKKTMIVEDSADTSDSEVFPMLSRPAKMRKSHLLDTDDEDDAETFDEKKTARDISHKDIYVSLVKDKYVSGKHTKTNRTYDSRHPCIFCSKTVCNFSHHILTRKHSNEDEVKQILNSCGKERKNLIAKLRLKAAHNHNINVLKRNKGEIFLLRRSRYEAGESEEDESEEDDEGKGDKCEQTIDIRKYGPCPRCLGWILLASIKRHFKVCCAADPNLSLSYTKNSLIVQSDIIMGKVTDEASPALVKEVFPIMLVDDVSKVAKHDDLIVNLGNQWMLRNRGNEIMRKYYTSSVMRLVAKLKKNCQMISELNDESMDGFLQPKHFDVVVKAALLCSAGDEEDLEDLKSPSNAVKLGHDIKRMLSTKLAKGIKESDNQKKKEAEEFRKLMDIEWGLRVTKLARSLMIEATFNQERKLPLPNDLKKLAQFLTNEIKDLDLEDATFAQFRKVANLNLVRITLYNRRRCHEVQAMRLTAYEMRKTGIDEVGAEIRGELTNFERHLLEHQDVVVLRGKTGRGVPVILPNDVKGSLQYLSNSTVRKSAGIPPNNKYVFANAGAGVFRAYDAIRDITQDPKAGLQMPSLIRTSNMRKYTATMLQAMNTTDAERQWVIDHLGHTMNVHREHYRQTSDLLERVEVAKILLIQDLNLVGKFHGKKLKDIQLDDIVATADVDANADHPAASDEPTEHIPVARAAAIGQNDEYIPDLDEMQQSEEDDYCNENYSKKKRKKAASSCTRQIWTQEEKE